MVGKKAQIKEDYEKSAEFYDTRYKEIQFDKYRTMLHKLKIEAPALDLGCGTGLLQEFFGSGITLFGSDFSLKMLKKARERGEIVRVCNLNENFPYETEKFATIFSFTVLQNVKEQENFLAGAKRILKPGGIFVLTTLKKVTNEKKLIKLLEKYFTIQERVDCGEDFGFVLKKI